MILTCHLQLVPEWNSRYGSQSRRWTHLCSCPVWLPVVAFLQVCCCQMFPFLPSQSPLPLFDFPLVFGLCFVSGLRPSPLIYLLPLVKTHYCCNIQQRKGLFVKVFRNAQILQLLAKTLWYHIPVLCLRVKCGFVCCVTCKLRGLLMSKWNALYILFI